jgi:hypothetical protein
VENATPYRPNETEDTRVTVGPNPPTNEWPQAQTPEIKSRDPAIVSIVHLARGLARLWTAEYVTAMAGRNKALHAIDEEMERARFYGYAMREAEANAQRFDHIADEHAAGRKANEV